MGLPAKYYLSKVHMHYLFNPEANCYKTIEGQSPNLFMSTITKLVSIFYFYCYGLSML